MSKSLVKPTLKNSKTTDKIINLDSWGRGGGAASKKSCGTKASANI
jgi:hypothetical protein